MGLLRSKFFVLVVVLCLASLFVVVYGQSRLDRGISGQFGTLVADFFDEGRAETVHYLIADDGREYEVVFAQGVTVPEPGSQVTLRGRVRGKTVFADGVISQIAPSGLGNSPLGEQRFVIALIRFQNDPPGNENVTIPQVLDKMFDPDYSVDDWFDEASYGKTFATGDVFGWFTLPMDRGCNASGWRSAVIPMLDALTDLTQYNRLYIMVPQAGGCTWGGLGTLGTNTFNTQDGQWTTTTSWTRSEYFNETLTNPRGAVFVTAHEVGHNFGQNHGESLTFNNNRAMGPFNCDGCEGTVTAYADKHSALGGSWRPGHHNAEHKRNLNWFNPGNILEVTRTGTYEISPYELDTDQPIVLRILRGFAVAGNRNEWLFGEWRQPIGYDAELDHFGNTAYNGIFVHWDYRTNTYGYNLDMTPGDGEMRNAPLPFGATWSDLYTKVSVQTLGVFGGKLRVQVTIGEPLPATSFTVVRGNLLSGGLPQVLASDDQKLTVASGITLNQTEPPVWLEFETTAPFNLPFAFRFELEARSSSVMRQRLRLFNYTSGAWDTVSDRDSSTTDTFVEANVWSNPGRYWHPTTRRMLARLEYFPDRPILGWPFTVQLDQAVWKVLQ
jgi:M6 family metalloprotease-like protein